MTRVYGGRQPPERPQERLTARPNELMTRTPLAQSAAQMERGDPQAMEPRLANILTWDAPPKMRRVPEHLTDRTGQRLGQLTVVGLLDTRGTPFKSGKWVVRCDCSMYETRAEKTLKNHREKNDKCVRCRTIVERKREQRRQLFYSLNGYWPHDTYGGGR